MDGGVKHWETVELFVLSDALSEEAEVAAAWCTRRFEKRDVEICRFPSLRKTEDIVNIAALAEERGAVILSCFLRKDLRLTLEEECSRRGVEQWDGYAPLRTGLERILGLPASEDRGLLHPMDTEYFRRVRAVEYSLGADDGGNPSLLGEADVVVLGISRTGKSPLCVYLAHRGILAANIPLVPGLDPPPQLFRIPSWRIFGLVRTSSVLGEIRTRRMAMMGLHPGETEYGQIGTIEREIAYASGIMERLGITVFDVTSRSIEETAYEILSLYRARREIHSLYGGAE